MEEKGNTDILEIVFSLIVDFENFHIWINYIKLKLIYVYF